MKNEIEISDDSIPIIDLSNDFEKEVIIDREEGRYLGHVSIIKYSVDNSLYATYVRGHGRGQAIVKRSRDEGKTWEDRMKLPESWLTLLQVPTLYELETKGITNSLVMITGHYPFRISYFDLETDTWGELEPIGSFGGNLAFSSMIKLKNGKYMGFFHDDGRFLTNKNKSNRFQLFKSSFKDDVSIELERSQLDSKGNWSTPKLDESTVAYTEDKWSNRHLIYESFYGIKSDDSQSKVYKIEYDPYENTWCTPEPVISHHDAYLGEPAVIYSPDQTQMLMLLRENTRKYNSFLSISTDDGQTWCKPFESTSELTGDRHIIKYSNDGRLIVSFRDSNPDSKTYGDWVLWIGTYENIVNSTRGQYKIRLKENYKGIDCGYSGIEIKDDGTILAVAYGHWIENQQPYITSKIIDLKHIDQILNSMKRMNE